MIESVDHPRHYTQGGIECIDAIHASMSPLEFAGFCSGNIIKYVWRYRDKGGLEDLKKAAWYLNALIKHAEEHGTPKEATNGSTGQKTISG